MMDGWVGVDMWCEEQLWWWRKAEDGRTQEGGTGLQVEHFACDDGALQQRTRRRREELHANVKMAFQAGVGNTGERGHDRGQRLKNTSEGRPDRTKANTTVSSKSRNIWQRQRPLQNAEFQSPHRL